MYHKYIIITNIIVQHVSHTTCLVQGLITKSCYVCVLVYIVSDAKHPSDRRACFGIPLRNIKTSGAADTLIAYVDHPQGVKLSTPASQHPLEGELASEAYAVSDE
jgi:hypothetical protein